MATLTIETLPVVDAIVERKNDLGLSTRALALRLGTSPSTVAYWERGAVTPNYERDLAHRIARFLGVTPLVVAQLFEVDLSDEPLTDPDPLGSRVSGG